MEGCEILMLRLARQPEIVIFDVAGGARILRAPLTATVGAAGRRAPGREPTGSDMSRGWLAHDRAPGRRGAPAPGAWAG